MTMKGVYITTVVVLAVLINVNSVTGCASGSNRLILTGNGSLTSQNYPNAYPNYENCEWLLTAAQPNMVAQLIFSQFATEYNYDGMFIYDGANSNATVLAILSGSYYEALAYHSNQQYMYVRFTSDNNVTDHGFSATFTSTTVTTTCSTTAIQLTGSGSFQSPNHTGKYPDYSDCHWLLQASPTNTIVEITFGIFSTELEFDFVRIYNGNTASSALIASVTGSPGTPLSYTTSQPSMYIRFTSDNNVTGVGFSATFTSRPSVNPVCSLGILNHTERGSLTSPNFPLTYPDNANCQWLLTALPLTSFIRLTFITFSTELLDFVLLYDGQNAAASPIAVTSGAQSTPLVFTSTQSSLFVRFLSDRSIGNTGFLATYSSVSAQSCSSLPCLNGGTCINAGVASYWCFCTSQYTRINCQTVSSACSSSARPLLLTGNGSFSSPNYPNFYPNSADCQWLLTASQSNRSIQLTVFNSTTESYYDYVNVYDGNTTLSTSIASLTGGYTSSTVYTSTQQFMLVQLTSSRVDGFAGFTASFTTVAGRVNTEVAACSASLRPAQLTDNGSFSSPYYPGNYPANADCQWLLATSQFKKAVQLTIVNSNTESYRDFVYVYDGRTASSSLIVRLSGGFDTSRVYKSTQQYMLVRLTSDSSGNFAGFTATFISFGSISDAASLLAHASAIILVAVSAAVGILAM